VSTLPDANRSASRSGVLTITTTSQKHHNNTQTKLSDSVTMKYYVLATLAIVPALASGFGIARWGLRRPIVVYDPVESLFRESQAMMNREFGQLDKNFGQFSPKYEIKNTDEKFELAVDVPGVKAADVNVSLTHDDQVLEISGERSSKGDNYSYSSQFYQSFSLDPSVITEKFDANLKDGVLVITAPKDVKKIEASTTSVPITEKEHAVEEPKEEKIEIEHKKEEVTA